MYLTRKHLSRRTLLKGAGVSVGLPLLDAMIPAGTALAKTDASDADIAAALDAVDALPKGINYAGYIGHSALRTWAMGERAFEEEAGDDDLDLMERQVGEFGARAFKFYNVRYDYGSPYPWRMDDPNIAFPVFEKAQELGVNLIGVHKGVPLGPQPIEHTQTWDMDGAAANFPDINFVIFHVGLPFLDETCWQLIRYPNLYASIAATINFVVRAPRMFAEILGKLLFWCGEDKIIYGSEAPLFHPQWALRAFMDFQIPQDLCEGYGYPQLTDQAKRKILGENLLRLHGMDLAEAKARLRTQP